jgi:hypothetical protein
MKINTMNGAGRGANPHDRKDRRILSPFFTVLRLVPGIYIVRGLVENKVIGDEQLEVTNTGTAASRLIDGKFFQGGRDTSTKSGPAIADPKGQIVSRSRYIRSCLLVCAQLKRRAVLR